MALQTIIQQQRQIQVGINMFSFEGMDFQTQKDELIKLISKTEDRMLITRLREFIGLQTDDSAVLLPDEVKQAIKEAKRELDRGEGIPHLQVMSEMRSRFLKS